MAPWPHAPTFMTTATEFRRFRKKHFFTQQKLAEVLGIHKNTIQNIERGKVTPFANTLHKFEVLKRKHAAGENHSSPVVW